MTGLAYYHRVIGLWGAISAIAGKLRGAPILYSARLPGATQRVMLRVPSSDVLVFDQVFLGKQYEFEYEGTPEIIVDAGANIGFTSLSFATRFPKARIIAIEPERRNFELLRKNTATFPNVRVFNGALWGADKTLEVVASPLGNWAFRTEEPPRVQHLASAKTHEVNGITIDRLMTEEGIDYIDILKIDIEGSELQVFADPGCWIDRVGAIIVELHERLVPGCNRAFYRATEGFGREWQQGESIFLSRGKMGQFTPQPN